MRKTESDSSQCRRLSKYSTAPSHPSEERIFNNLEARLATKTSVHIHAAISRYTQRSSSRPSTQPSKASSSRDSAKKVIKKQSNIKNSAQPVVDCLSRSLHQEIARAEPFCPQRWNNASPPC